ncbi:MFS transporter [Streptomyces sp. NPDC049040]|uniref:MFS transporter n=1 Tax=Streptomyces sp. NPDC049040 TaxID=3365593 RepID=UPI003719455E
MESVPGGDEREKVRERRPTRPFVPLVALCTGYFMVILDATAVSVALPRMGHDLGGGLAGLQWVADGYTVAFAALLLSAGAVGDRIGAKPVFQVGLGLFVVTSIGCGAAPELWVLVTMRVLQGLSAALMVPTSLALIHASYQDEGDRTRAIGVWGGVGGVAAAAGPVLGGVLTAALSWRAVFFVNVPVGLLGLFLTARHVVAPRPERGRGMDRSGQLAGAVMLAAAVYALIEAGHSGWAAGGVLVAALLAVLAAAAFLLVERRTADPMVPLDVFRSRTLSSSTLVGFLMNAGFYGQLFVMTFYFQQVRGWSALEAGLALLPQTAMAALASALSGRTAARTGPRTPMWAGMLIGAAGFAGLLATGADTPYLWLVPPLAAIGFGMAFTMPAAMSAAVEEAPPGRAGLASGVMNASRQVGSAVGIALLGALVADRSGFVPGMHTGSAVAGGGFLAAAALAWFGVHRDAPSTSTDDAKELLPCRTSAREKPTSTARQR